MKRSFFISFEGIEGTGKTTQARLLYEFLIGRDIASVLTEEPGGTRIGRLIREVLLSPEHKEMNFMTELLLYNADRCQHISDVIMPAMNEGRVVITDRFFDSTLAYQGYGRGIDRELITALDWMSTGGLKPNLTILLDMDAETGLRRNRSINKTDRLELEDIEFHRRVREGYLKIKKDDPGRIKLVDASGSIGQIHGKVAAEALRHIEGL